MKRLVLSLNITLDGCCDHTQVIADEALHRYATDLLEHASGVLFGRVTYQLFESYWPSVAASGAGPESEVAFARTLNNKAKYVVSNTLSKVAWENSFVIAGDLAREIAKLKQEDGNDLVILGSPGLASALAQLGLIDEYQILVQPIIAGRGPTAFHGIGQRLDLRLVGTSPFSSGVVMFRYIPIM